MGFEKNFRHGQGGGAYRFSFGQGAGTRTYTLLFLKNVLRPGLRTHWVKIGRSSYMFEYFAPELKLKMDVLNYVLKSI